jgi:hypothetical protein
MAGPREYIQHGLVPRPTGRSRLVCSSAEGRAISVYRPRGGRQMARIYSLFLSHSWTHGDSHRQLRHLLDRKPFFLFKDHSLPADDPIHDEATVALLAVRIEQQMLACDIVLVLTGVYATYSKWIDREIDVAKNRFGRPKPILAIRPEDSDEVSAVLQDNSDRIVGWDAESVVGAICELVGDG